MQETGLATALKRIDLLLHREILRLRARYQLSLDEFRGLYVSDEQVDHLVTEHLQGEISNDISQLEQQADQLWQVWMNHLPKHWRHVVTVFGLNHCEQDLLLLALAPELDLKYETIYGYLNNDISRRYPSIDLASRVLARDPQDAWLIRHSLSAQSRLRHEGLLDVIKPTDAEQRSELSYGFRLAAPLKNYLLRLPLLDSRFSDVLTINQQSYDPQSFWCVPKIQVPALAAAYRQQQGPDLLILQGEEGSGRRAFMRALCYALNRPLLEIDVALLTQKTDFLEADLRQIRALGRLLDAGLCWHGFESIQSSQNPLTAAWRQALRKLSWQHTPVAFTVISDIDGQQIFSGRKALRIPFTTPAVEERRQIWQFYSQLHGVLADPQDLNELADRFVLNPGQIERAIDQTRLDLQLQDGDCKSNLFQAARDVSIAELGKLAQKVELKFSWQDLVLPDITLQRIHEIAFAMQHRYRVYGEWGMGQRVQGAQGLVVLFAGSSGTGKTMTAGVIAREIGLHLYRIDLAGIVSKYIGETEKNLDRIFNAAERANAILFFDEADALFGKRSEVKDAHDRYANIEVAYLLQKIESHPGVVILATNLSKNIDQAFSRRMHYIVEFPRPEIAAREMLWQKAFSEQTPLAADVDFNFLARQFQTTGGEIKNIALDAAFLAVQNADCISMETLVRAVARQLRKQGKLPSSGEFKHYQAILQQSG